MSQSSIPGTLRKTSVRAKYESMSRGDLIDALCAVDATPEPGSVRLYEQTKKAHDELADQVRRANEALARAEALRLHFADLFESAPTPYCVLDRNGVIVDANAALATLLCVTAGTLGGMQLARVAGIAEKPTFMQYVSRCLDERLRVSTELRATVRGRGELTLQMVSSPRVIDGIASHCRTTLHDVSRSKRLLDHAQLLATILERIDEARDGSDLATVLTKACVPVLGDAVFVDVCDGSSVRRASVTLDAAHGGSRARMEAQAADPSWHAYVTQLVANESTVFEPSSAAALGVGIAPEIGANAVMLVPLVSRGKPVGLFGALRIASAPYSLDELELAQSVARCAARALAVAKSS